MKKIIMTAALLSSVSAFSAQMSEFERGYNAGLASCSDAAVWSCTIKSAPSDANTTGFYYSRASALIALSEASAWKNAQVYAGNYECKKY